jgi:hypothetical protein
MQKKLELAKVLVFENDGHSTEICGQKTGLTAASEQQHTIYF